MENLAIEITKRKFTDLKNLRGFKYSPQTGNVYRSQQQGRNGARGVIRGKNPGGYLHFQYKGKMISCHRAAFQLRNIDPTGMEVDHINGIRADNRWENLRLVTSRDNANNKSFHRNGRKVGARFCNQKNKWLSEIIIGGKSNHLGFFLNEDDAHNAYIEAKTALVSGNEIKKRIRKPRTIDKKVFISVIKSKGKSFYLGSFKSVEKANEAYQFAKEKIAIGIFPSSLRGNTKKYRARITVDGKRIDLGRYATKEEMFHAQNIEKVKRLGV